MKKVIKERKKVFRARNVMIFTLLTFIISIVFIIVRIILAPSIAPPSDITERVKSDYILMLLQSVLGVTAILIPHLLSKKARLNVPSVMVIVYAIFLYCGIYLGEVRNFFHIVPHWDTVLHVFSGAALGALGFSIVGLLNKPESTRVSLSPLFVAMFAFCFAITIGVIWEIYEFAMDYFWGTNMQKFALENGTLLIGQEALKDTMKDLIVDCIGAFVVSAVGYFSLKHNKGWVEHFKIEQHNDVTDSALFEEPQDELAEIK